MPIIFHSRLPPITPCASAEISVACGAGSGFGATHADVRRAGEAVRLGEQVEHGRNHRRARADADDQRDLLAHRRRADELAGLEILQVVVRDRRAGEHDRRDEQRERDERRPRRPPSASRRATSTDAQSTIDRMPTPEIGLFDAPISPAM